MNGGGTVYLIHFERPYFHAQHYLGYTEDVAARFDRHDNGHGSPLLRAVAEAGIAYHVVRTWDGDRSVERSLKRRKNGRDLCPVCAYA